MVFLWSEACYANKQKVIFAEPLSCSPLSPRGLRTPIIFRRNTVRDHLALLNPIKTLYAECDFFRNGNRNDSVAKGVTVNPARLRFDLTFRQVVNGMQQ